MKCDEFIDWAQKDGYIKSLNKYIQVCEIGDDLLVTFRLSPYKVKGYDPQQTSSFSCDATYNPDGTCESTVNGETIHLEPGEQDWRRGVYGDYLDLSLSLESNIELLASIAKDEE